MGIFWFWCSMKSNLRITTMIFLFDKIEPTHQYIKMEKMIPQSTIKRRYFVVRRMDGVVDYSTSASMTSSSAGLLAGFSPPAC